MEQERPDRTLAFAAEGEVVEILEDVGARRAKVVLKQDCVIDVLASEDSEVHLGDHVALEGTITIDRIRVKVDSATHAAR